MEAAILPARANIHITPKPSRQILDDGSRLGLSCESRPAGAIAPMPAASAPTLSLSPCTQTRRILLGTATWTDNHQARIPRSPYGSRGHLREYKTVHRQLNRIYDLSVPPPRNQGTGIPRYSTTVARTNGIGFHHTLSARPYRPAVRVPRVANSPPAFFAPSLTTTPLPSTYGWCHQPSQGTHTLERLTIPGVTDRAAPSWSGPIQDTTCAMQPSCRSHSYSPSSLVYLFETNFFHAKFGFIANCTW